MAEPELWLAQYAFDSLDVYKLLGWKCCVHSAGCGGVTCQACSYLPGEQAEGDGLLGEGPQAVS